MSSHSLSSDGVIINVKAVLRSRRPGVEVDASGGLRVKVTATPVDGKANAAILELIARCLGVKHSSLEIVRGRTSRRKEILVRTTDTAKVIQAIEGMKP